MFTQRLLTILWFVALTFYAGAAKEATAAESFQFGLAKVDITPHAPLRLSGYGNRTAPFTGVDEHLWARSLAIRTDDERLAVLVSVDTIGFPGKLTATIAEQVRERFQIPRQRFVICFTHTHTAPHITDGLTNIFSLPLTKQEAAAAGEYTKRLGNQVIESVGLAIADLAPGTLHFGQGEVGFAQNRRALRDGRWAGFGVNPPGPVDHSLPLLKIVGTDGQLRGVVFNYACHCTTFDSNHNRVNGDWAGYATKYIEEQLPEAVALCTIGCGADMNPPRDRDKAMEFAQAEGQEIAAEVRRLIATDMQAIDERLSTSFGSAALPVDQPSSAELRQQLESRQPQSRQHAKNMLAILQRTGELPAKYQAPITVWRFGDQLSMVFLSGEVVVDYVLRLQREVSTGNLWVSAYANDLFGYLASERVRREGGYEVDTSMIYYNQPGPWREGTEELVIRRVHELRGALARE